MMRRRVALRLIAGYGHWDFLERLGLELPPAFVEIAARKDARLAGEAAAALPVEAVRKTVLAGNPERVAAQVAEVLRPEITNLTIRPHGLPGQGVAPVLRAFAEEVMPRVERLR